MKTMKKYFKILALGLILFTGCNCIPPKQAKLQRTAPIEVFSCDEKFKSYSYKDTFEFEQGKGLFPATEVIILLYTPGEASGFLTMKTKGGGSIKSLLIRSKKTGRYIKAEKPVIITTQNQCQTASFSLTDKELISLLKIIQQEDVTIKINSYFDYKVVRHKKTRKGQNMLFASSFEKFILLSKRNFKSV